MKTLITGLLILAIFGALTTIIKLVLGIAGMIVVIIFLYALLNAAL